MYARHVSIVLKADSRADVVHKVESEILPLLREQKGFVDQISFIDPAGKDAIAVSLWDSKEDAEAYSRRIFPKVYGILADMIEGSPRVQCYEVTNSTFHKIAANREAA
ncbi:MAG: hypothetical protein WB812_15100 [Woeseiaceae bacterium]